MTADAPELSPGSSASAWRTPRGGGDGLLWRRYIGVNFTDKGTLSLPSAGKTGD
jgi:hypothetical protein